MKFQLTEKFTIKTSLTIDEIYQKLYDNIEDRQQSLWTMLNKKNFKSNFEGTVGVYGFEFGKFDISTSKKSNALCRVSGKYILSDDLIEIEVEMQPTFIIYVPFAIVSFVNIVSFLSLTLKIFSDSFYVEVNFPNILIMNVISVIILIILKLTYEAEKIAAKTF